MKKNVFFSIFSWLLLVSTFTQSYRKDPHLQALQAQLDTLTRSPRVDAPNLQSSPDADLDDVRRCLGRLRTELGDHNELMCSKVDGLEDDHQFICSKIEGLAPCDPTPITESTTITKSGPYCLSNDITDGPITIDANSVCLDLNCFRITNSETSIILNQGTQEIVIKNGTIGGGTTKNGISGVCNNCITMKDLYIVDCEQSGIDLFATKNVVINNSLIKNCTTGLKAKLVRGAKVTHCTFSFNEVGTLLVYSNKMVFNNCCSFSNSIAGFKLFNSMNNTFKHCKASDNGQGGNGDAFGFVSNNGMCNIFEKCIADGTRTNATDDRFVAAGFALTNCEMCSKIIDSESCNTMANPNGLAIPYGILLKHNGIGKTAIVDNEIHGATIESVHWSPDGKFLAVGGVADGGVEIRVYSFDASTKMLTEEDSKIHGNDIFSVNWSPDGKFLAIGGNTGDNGFEIRIYSFDAITKKLTLEVSETHGNDIFSVHWSPDGKFLAVGGALGDPDNGGPIPSSEIRVYEFDASTKTLAETDSQNHDGVIKSVHWSPNGKFLAIGGNTGNSNFEIRVYEFDSSTKKLTEVDQKTHGSAIFSVNWSPDGKFLAVGGDTFNGVAIRVYSFDASTKTLTKVDQKTHGNTISVNWSPDGKFLAVGGETGGGVEIRIYSFDASTKKLTEVVTAVHGNTIFSVNWSPNGKFLAVGGDAGTGMSEIRVLEVNVNFLVLKNSQEHGDDVRSVAWSPDGKFLAIGGNTGDPDGPIPSAEIRVYEYDLINNMLILRDSAIGANAHGARVNEVAWSPDGKFLAIGGFKGTDNDEIRVYSFDPINKTLTLEVSKDHDNEIVNSVHWSPDGKFLAIGGNTAGGIQIRVYEFNPVNETLTEVTTEPHGTRVNSVRWSPDGKFLAIGGDNGTGNNEVRVYSFDPNNKTLTVLPGSNQNLGFPAAVESVNWSPNGKFLAVAGASNRGPQLRVFKFDPVNETLMQVDTKTHGNTLTQVTWSSDGKFLAVTGREGNNNFEARVYAFDANTELLTEVETFNHGSEAALITVDWSPDGKSLAVGGVTGTGEFEIRVFCALRFPSKNVIKDNVIYCTVGNLCPAGIGISGTSLCNLIIGNTAYQNIKNYEFVTNVFTGGINGTPSILENVSVPPF